MQKFEALEKAMHKELELIDQKLKNGQEMSIQDLEKADKLAHALKSLATYCAMKDAEDDYYEDREGMSGRRGRNMMNGQYMSRDMAPHDYYEGQSGHYMMPYRVGYPPRY